MFERDADLDVVRAALREARGGHGRLLVVEGPPGIGKTQLLAAAMEAARAEGARITVARGTELERDFAYGIVRQLFEKEVIRATDDERARLLAGAAALAGPVFGMPAPADEGFQLPGADPKFAALHGLYWLLSHLAAEQPWLIVVDDAHWADAASLRFMSYLLPRLDEMAALVLVATRPDEPGIETEMLRAIAMASSVTYLRPEPLTTAGVAALLAAVLQEQVDHDLAEAAREATDGNPFLVGELARALTEAGTKEPRDLQGLRLPAVERSVLLRLARAGEAGRRVAEAVAILGERSTPPLVARLADVDAELLERVVAQLAREGVLTQARPLRFTHPLLRSAVADAIPAVRAAALHRRAASILSETGAPAEAAALHLLNTEALGDPAVASTLIEASRDALARGAPDAAARFLERAQIEPPQETQRGDLLYLLGSAQAGMSDLACIETLGAALAASPDPADKARIVVELAHVMVIADRQQEVVPIIEELLANQPDPAYVPRLRAELAVAAGGHAATRDVAVACLEEAAPRLLQQAPEQDTLEDRMLLAILAFGVVTSGLAEAGPAIALAERALGSDELPPPGSWIALGSGLIALAAAGRPGQAQEWFDRAAEAATWQGSLLMSGLCGCWGAHAALQAGDLAGAESRARAAIDIGGLSNWGQVNCERAFLAQVLLEQGAADAADAALADRGLWGSLPQNIWATFVLETRARVRLAQGRAGEALEEARRCATLSEALGAHGAALGAWRGIAALAAGHKGDRTEALRRADDAVAAARAFGAAPALGAALRVRGLVDESSDGVLTLQEAVGVLQESDARLELARAFVDLGARLRRSGQPRKAREPLLQGADVAARIGAAVLLTRAREELRAAGARPRRAALTGAAALTGSERRVAELAAAGATNREIAQTLFVTLRTVEMHLSSAYRKLGISGRSELAAALQEPAVGA